MKNTIGRPRLGKENNKNLGSPTVAGCNIARHSYHTCQNTRYALASHWHTLEDSSQPFKTSSDKRPEIPASKNMDDTNGQSSIPRRRVTASGQSVHQEAPSSDQPSHQEAAGGRRRRSRFTPSRLLVVGLLFSVTVSGLLAWRLLRVAQPAADLDPDALGAALSAALVGQKQALATLVAHVRRARATGARRLDFLALGPAGTGKTLLCETLAALGGGLAARRLVGGAEIGRDRAALNRLAADLLTVAAPGAWLLLALDDVSQHLPESVYLLETVADAAATADVRLLTLVTATTADLAGERGADAEREAFRHAHQLRFRPLRRAALADCVRRYAATRGVRLDPATVDAVLAGVPYEGQYAADGCKPAIYRLQTLHEFRDG